MYPNIILLKNRNQMRHSLGHFEFFLINTFSSRRTLTGTEHVRPSKQWILHQSRSFWSSYFPIHSASEIFWGLILTSIIPGLFPVNWRNLQIWRLYHVKYCVLYRANIIVFSRLKCNFWQDMEFALRQSNVGRYFQRCWRRYSET